jgi:hypothetical protein
MLSGKDRWRTHRDSNVLVLNLRAEIPFSMGHDVGGCTVAVDSSAVSGGATSLR